METFEKIDLIEVDRDRKRARVTLWLQPDDEWGMTRHRQSSWGVQLRMVFEFDPTDQICTIWERAVAAAKEWTTASPNGHNPPDGFAGSEKLQGGFPYGWPDRVTLS